MRMKTVLLKMPMMAVIINIDDDHYNDEIDNNAINDDDDLAKVHH